jgi:tight adherence protein B
MRCIISKDRFFSKKELMMECIKGLLLLAIGGWLCFHHIGICLVAICLLPLYLKSRVKEKQHRKKMAIQKEFKDAMAILYSSTAAGGTLEKAFRDAVHDMKLSEKRYTYLLPEFERICVCLNRNIPMSQALSDFAGRMGDDDIDRFVQVIAIARRSGGSLAEIIRQSADTMTLRLEINSEIETMLAGRQGELKVMMIVPAGILIYMNLCSADYMSVLYLTPAGRMVMMVSLFIYLGAICIGKKILDIRI